MRWVGHIEYMGERKGACRVLVRKPEGKRPLLNPATDWRVILKLISKKWNGGGGGGGAWFVLPRSRDGGVAGGNG